MTYCTATGTGSADKSRPLCQGLEPIFATVSEEELPRDAELRYYPVAGTRAPRPGVTCAVLADNQFFSLFPGAMYPVRTLRQPLSGGRGSERRPQSRWSQCTTTVAFMNG